MKITRQKLRSLIFERVSDYFSDEFDFSNNSGIKTKDTSKPKSQRAMDVELYGYTIIVQFTDGDIEIEGNRYSFLFAYFDSIFKMKDYISSWSSEVDLGDYSHICTDHFDISISNAKEKLFSVYPDADTIRIHDFSDPIFYNEKPMNFKTDCKYVSQWTREAQGDDLICYELFNDDLRSDPRGYYLITKEGKITWAKT